MLTNVSLIKMAEEIKNASVVVPRAVLFSLGINGILGLGMLLAYLLCLGDIDAALEAQYTLGYPFLQVFWNGTGSRNGAGVMGLIIVILGICSTVGVLASSSRMLWSFARDRGVPFWKYFVRVRNKHILRCVPLTLANIPTFSAPQPNSNSHIHCGIHHLGVCSSLTHHSRLERRLQQHCQPQRSRSLLVVSALLCTSSLAAPATGWHPILQ